MEEKITKVFDNIVEKAEFLLKLHVPSIFLVKESEKKKQGTLLMIKEPSITEG